MKQPDNIPRWYFVDESGDTAFYANRSKRLIVGEEGCSRTLILGFLRTRDPQDIRGKLAEVRLAISTSKYLQGIPSVRKSLVCLHAKDDCPEVRQLVFEAIDKMSFSCQVVVARKIEGVFQRNHKGSEDHFYDDLVTRLFFGQLHRSNRSYIVFAQRGNKNRQHALRAAVQKSVSRFLSTVKEDTCDARVFMKTSQPLQEPVLQVIDYVNWAIQRAYEKGQMRYFELLRNRVELLRDIYDFERKRRKEKCAYNRENNHFDIKNASPLS
jgi:hypothetical protein